MYFQSKMLDGAKDHRGRLVLCSFSTVFYAQQHLQLFGYRVN